MKGDILFLHPDLGVGGAERLVVDAAIALQNNGYKVSFITSHHDPNHSFQETNDGTLTVNVVGNWIPRQVFGRFFALCAYLKMIYCALYVVFFLRPDVVVVDLVSVCVPFLKLKSFKVVFYCHFPDQLLTKTDSFLKKIYRAPLNWFEEKSTGSADKIFVNSLFTRKVFHRTFTTLKVEPDVLYPSINTSFYDKMTVKEKENNFVFLSVNRYERKKHMEIAIKAMKILVKSLSSDSVDKVKLFVVGGYDSRVDENVEYFEELAGLTSDLGLDGKVRFFKSPSDVEKAGLLRNCSCLIYTPPNEHFGIVPLEAMYAKKPVIACNSGGPTETVVHEVTGLLCDFDPTSFADAMIRIYRDDNLRNSMGEAGRRRFEDNFSFQSFSRQLSHEIARLVVDKEHD